MYGIKIEKGTNISIPRQICSQLRILIESGELRNGVRLPSTRKIAGELDINRNIMVEVYEQLIAEGYLKSRVGSGTFVSAGISAPFSRPSGMSAGATSAVFAKETPAPHYTDISPGAKALIEFETGIPDLALFPAALWGKYLRQASENSYHFEENLHEIMGDKELRNVLSGYLLRVKGIRCSPEQIMIVSGSSGGFLLIAQALSKLYARIFLEDPTVDFTRNIFLQMGYSVIPIPVDRSGMDVPALVTQKDRGLILLTPSHQFPTGSILSTHRRLNVIEMAENTESYIIEDDYDSEFRFRGMPIPPLQVLSPSRVIYVGTFSKTLFPGLRIGFVVIPDQLTGILSRAKSSLNMYTSVIEQRALANFISEGHLDRHIYKMKNVYKKRRASLIEYLTGYFGDEAAIIGDEAGMHIQVEFLKRNLPPVDWDQSRKYGIAVETVEDYCMIKGNNSNKIVLGYGNIGQSQMEEGVKTLYRFVRALYSMV